MKHRKLTLSTVILLVLAMLPAVATAAGPGTPVGQHCEDHTTETKVEVPAGWDFDIDGPYVAVVSVLDTSTGGLVDVTVTIDGQDVSLSSADGLDDASFCIKGGTGNTGPLEGVTGDTESIPNRGGKTPTVSYVVLYSVTTVDVPVVQCDDSTSSGGAGVTTTAHELGQNSGTFDFTYTAYSVPDRFQVFYEGALIHDEVIGTSANSAFYAPLFDPGGIFEGTGSVDAVSSKSVALTYGPGSATQVVVTVSGPGGTVWDYTVFCPEED